MAHLKRTLFWSSFAAPYVAASFYLTLWHDNRPVQQGTQAENQPAATARRLPIPSPEQRNRLVEQQGRRAKNQHAGTARPVAMPNAEQQSKRPKQKPATATLRGVVPVTDKTVLLVRTTLLTLNNALRSGNFTVLRDLSAPAFRKANSEAKLARAFKPFRDKKIDLIAVAIKVPKLSEKPVIDKQKLLHIKGHFPGKPRQIHFNLTFQAVHGRWRLLRLSVNPVRVSQGATKAPAKKPPKNVKQRKM